MDRTHWFGEDVHTWFLSNGRHVPGTQSPCHDGYEIAQILARAAAQRGDITQRLQWRGQIQGLRSRLIPVHV